MKRSEFFERFKALLVEAGVSPYDAELDAGVEASHYASSGRLIWDSEGPEVLWEALNPPGGWHAFQILSDGSVRSRGPSDAGEWRKHTEPLHPIHAELARRLLEERKQQQALDEHNDKLEADRADRAIWSTLNEHQDRLDAFDSTVHPDLDRRLTKVEEDLLLVRGQAAHVDEKEAADYLSTQERLAALERKVDQLGEGVVDNVNCLDRRIDLLESQPTPGVAGDLPAGAGATQREASSRWVQVDREVYDGLLAVWRLWGPDGELRRLLRSHDRPGYGWYSQLRSELLALPDEVKP